MIDRPSSIILKDLRRWFKEEWVDVSRKNKKGEHPPCGRDEAKTDSKGYPKCRPKKKVSSKTPKTAGSMSAKEKKRATRRKRSKPQGVGGKPTMVKSCACPTCDLLTKTVIGREKKPSKDAKAGRMSCITCDGEGMVGGCKDCDRHKVKGGTARIIKPSQARREAAREDPLERAKRKVMPKAGKPYTQLKSTDQLLVEALLR